MKPSESKLFTEIINAAISIAPDTEIKLPITDTFVLGSYWRSISLFRGVVELLKSNLSEEALILSRSLFTESMRLMEISQADKRRGSLILGWANQSYNEIKGLFLEAHRLGLDPDAEKVVTHYEQQQQKLQNYARRHSVGRFGKFRPEGDAAKRFGRQDDYWTFLLSHAMVHGSDAAYVFRRKKIGESAITLFPNTNDPAIVASVGIFAAKSLLDGAKATAQIFSWSLPAHFDSFYERLESLVERKDTGGIT